MLTPRWQRIFRQFTHPLLKHENDALYIHNRKNKVAQMDELDQLRCMLVKAT